MQQQNRKEQKKTDNKQKKTNKKHKNSRKTHTQNSKKQKKGGRGPPPAAPAVLARSWPGLRSIATGSERRQKEWRRTLLQPLSCKQKLNQIQKQKKKIKKKQQQPTNKNKQPPIKLN